METASFDVGALNARLVREVQVDEPDGQGGVTRRFVAAGRFWARIDPVAHRADLIAAAAERVTVTHRIWIAAKNPPSPGERLVKGLRRFAVKAVRDPDETARFWICDCEEEI
ncbi:phage head closure protein [Rhizobium sp. SSA_523]|uniref:phage head closure protein n=1 Tax=Rhizobium sp. SSA_523 TaxID=2952477 RepID=UPI00209058B9|nr:phage head closure protein [Rhizobium sp. SSA_523]MCO5730907.1 phage head closure protein [Rhizobium sp. SSA_523]WKC24280.1 phage head closure protein [Rhizobium sp. SSA_523]